MLARGATLDNLMKIKTFASCVISSLQAFFFFADFVVKLMILCEVQEDSE